MKPSFRSLFKATLPALIVVPSLLQPLHAGAGGNLITPYASGDVNVPGDHDELFGTNWSVIASGGNASPFLATIQQGASLTGDDDLRNAVVVSAGNYTIDNFGTLNAASHGVTSSAGDTIVNNYSGGSITGGWNGVNFGYMEKTILFDSIDDIAGGGSVMNEGEITGGSNGIYSGSGLSVINHESGTISGNYGNGISAGDDLLLTNHGSITGGALGNEIRARLIGPIYYKSSSGVYAWSDATITNTGSIIGETGHGISAFNGLTLTNSGTIEGNGIGGFIDTKISVIDEPEAETMAFGIGVVAGDNARIDNLAGATISGTYNGINAGRFLTLTNAGSISGTSESGGNAGVQTGDGSHITNSGTITGDVNGIVIAEPDFFPEEGFLTKEVAEDLSSTITSDGGSIVGTTGSGVLGSAQTQTLTNSNGVIAGKISAIDLGAGDDLINLGFGSVIQGDITGGEGIDTLNFTAGSASILEESNIVHGNVGGIETINKTGSGFAFIGGVGESFNVFTDAINVSSGGLVINGNLASLSEGKTVVTLTNGGRLDGTGDWHADLFVTNGGISAGGTNDQFDGVPDDATLPLSSRKDSLSPTDNSSVGTLTFNGNFNVDSVLVDVPIPMSTALKAPASSAYIREDIAPQTPIKDGVNSDLIVQNGAGNTFNVAGLGIRVSPTGINETLTDGTYTIVDSDSPLAGFDDIGRLGVQFRSNAPDTGDFIATESGENNLNTVLGNYFTTVGTADPRKGGDSDLVLTIEHNFAGLPGLSDSQSAFGAALDSSVNSSNPLVQDFIAALDYSDLATVQGTLAALDPSSTMGLANVVVNSNYRLHRLTQEHLAGIRGSGREVSQTAPATTDSKGAVVPGQTTTRLAGRANAWGSLSYDGQDNNAAGSVSDFDGDSGAFTAGFDWLVAPKLVLGIVLDGNKGNFDGTGTDSDVDSFRGAVYGTWGERTGLYSDFLLGYGGHNLDSDRDAVGILAGGTSSDTDATSLQALLTVGYTMGDERLIHGPFAGLEYQNVDVDGFTQQGPLPVQVGGYDVDSLRALIGYRVNANLGTFRPYASAAYAHEFEDGGTSTTASFGGAPFSVSGADQSSAILLGLGTGIALSEALTLDVGYRGDIAVDDGLTSHGGSIGLNYAF